MALISLFSRVQLFAAIDLSLSLVFRERDFSISAQARGDIGSELQLSRVKFRSLVAAVLPYIDDDDDDDRVCACAHGFFGSVSMRHSREAIIIESSLIYTVYVYIYI